MATINKVMVGESLVGEGNEVAHIDLIIGPRGSAAESAFCNSLTNNKDGFTTLLAVVAPNLPCKPNTVMFNKVTIKGAKQAVQMFGPAQTAVARAVADSRRLCHPDLWREAGPRRRRARVREAADSRIGGAATDAQTHDDTARLRAPEPHGGAFSASVAVITFSPWRAPQPLVQVAPRLVQRRRCRHRQAARLMRASPGPTRRGHASRTAPRFHRTRCLWR